MKFTFLLLLLGLAACSSAQKSPGTVPGNAQKILIHGDDRIGTYVSIPDGFSTASYWIEGPKGLILIDTQFLPSAGIEAVEWAERASGKKVLLAIVLHPNPDKFNGTTELQKRGIRVVTSEQVRALIPEVHKDRHHWFYERYKPDYPNEAPAPESFGSKSTDLSAGGISVTAHVLNGPGCSGSHVVVEFDKHIFVGDLVASLGHSWLELGLLDDWLKRVGEMRKLKPNYIHPGRGPSGGPELLDRQEAYLKRVKTLVLAEKPRKISEEKRDAVLAKVQAKLEKEYIGYDNSFFLEVGLPNVWEKLAK